MKLAKCTTGSEPFWAVVDPDAGQVRAIAGAFAQWAPALTADPGGAPPLTGDEHALDDVTLLLPVEPYAMVVATGATYAKHIEGMGLQMPERPGAFLRTYRSLVGPGEEIAYPAVTEALDYEAELVVVIGAPDVDPADPFRAVLGYTVGNEVSARDLQFAGSVTGMDMFSAKALDGTGPIGPWIVTRDEFGDGTPDLELRLTVDGELRQHDRTGSLVWGVDHLIAYVNARASLHCGDVLWTGTCAGVAHEDGRYLQPGQEVVTSIEGIGELRNVVGARAS
jgi:2-keto-4-pentenoate hydratase/2-oxohepta-3-ene-1,7-dioic acid hydratase in catechol pathway